MKERVIQLETNMLKLQIHISKKKIEKLQMQITHAFIGFFARLKKPNEFKREKMYSRNAFLKQALVSYNQSFNTQSINQETTFMITKYFIIPVF